MFAQDLVFFIQHALMMIQKMKLFALVMNGPNTKSAILLEIAQPDMFWQPTAAFVISTRYIAMDLVGSQ
jgi:hypothetical protein